MHLKFCWCHFLFCACHPHLCVVTWRLWPCQTPAMGGLYRGWASETCAKSLAARRTEVYVMTNNQLKCTLCINLFCGVDAPEVLLVSLLVLCVSSTPLRGDLAAVALPNPLHPLFTSRVVDVGRQTCHLLRHLW